MTTDDLIETLLRDDVRPKKRSMSLRFAIAVLDGIRIGFGLLIALLGLRPDIRSAFAPVTMKTAFSALAMGLCLLALTSLSRPGRPLGWRIAAISSFLVLSAFVVGVALIGREPSERMDAWLGREFPWGIVVIPILALPTAVLLGWLVRDFAPTRLRMAGAAVGSVAGGAGAMIYAMYCPTDSMAFVATWYIVSIALCAAIGALLGPRFLRW